MEERVPIKLSRLSAAKRPPRVGRGPVWPPSATGAPYGVSHSAQVYPDGFLQFRFLVAEMRANLFE
jgi:hypothetical protein